MMVQLAARLRRQEWQDAVEEELRLVIAQRRALKRIRAILDGVLAKLGTESEGEE